MATIKESSKKAPKNGWAVKDANIIAGWPMFMIFLSSESGAGRFYRSLLTLREWARQRRLLARRGRVAAPAGFGSASGDDCSRTQFIRYLPVNLNY